MKFVFEEYYFSKVFSTVKEKGISFFINVANVMNYMTNISRNLFSNKLEFKAFLIISKLLFFCQVNHLFAGADQDVNGLLSFQEIIDNHDLFVGSEVTTPFLFLNICTGKMYASLCNI